MIGRKGNTKPIVIMLLAVSGFLVTGFFFLTSKNPVTPPNNSRVVSDAVREILPIQLVTSGEIPQFAALLKQARDAKDTTVCDSLPTPQPQSFFFDDYTVDAPSITEWKIYCRALVSGTPALCSTIESHIHPNLQEECQYVLENALFSNNGSNDYCMENLGSIFHNDDDVRNCLLNHHLENSTAFNRSLYGCLAIYDDLIDYPRPGSKLTSEHRKCLYDLAVTEKNPKICLLIKDVAPPGYTYTRQNCKIAVNAQ